MNHEELIAQLADGPDLAVYLVAGEEPLLRDDAVAAIREAVLASGPRDYNHDRLEGERTTAAALGDAVSMLPVMAPHRLVELREPESNRGGAKELCAAIADAVERLREQLEIVLLVVATRVDHRARWVKAFGKQGTVRCDPPRAGRETAAFVRAEAKRQGVDLERGVPERLAERTGPQLLLLRQEIAKAGLLAGPGERVTVAHVVAGSSDVAEQPLWDLTDAIGEGRGADALVVLTKQLKTGSAPMLVLAALANHFRKLLRVRCGEAVAGPPFVRRKLAGQAERYSTRRLLNCLRAIHETDTAFKGAGALRPELALERLVIGLSA